jgi:predicted  nucleic acid-binding Zn-ribbon protein
MVLRMPPAELTASSVLIDILIIVGWMTAFVVVLALAFFVVGWLFWTLSHLLPRVMRERIGRLFRHVYYDIFDGAWKLAALGSAALALTAASAFTTWGGLRSFTEHHSNGQSTLVGLSLAFAIAFGIQSVMLIAAWNIGDTYAAALPVRASNADARRRAFESWVGIALGVLLAGLIAVWLRGALVLPATAVADALWHQLTIIAETFVLLAMLIGTAYGLRGNEFIGPYIRGLGIIVKNAVIWLMFIAAMTVSVFFSFDYHFNAIFDATQRADAADRRAQQKLSSVTGYLKERMPQRLDELQKELFASKAWTEYLAQLGMSGRIAERSPALVQQRDREERKVQQDRIADLEKTLTELETKIGPLKVRSDVLTPKLESRKAQLQESRQQEEKQKVQMDKLEQEVAAAKAAAKRELGGVPGEGLTGREGAGTEYGKALKKVRTLESDLSAAKTEMTALHDQAENADKDVTNMLAEQAGFQPVLNELTSKAKAAREALNLERGYQTAASTGVDPTAVSRTIVNQTEEFRQGPTPKILSDIQRDCSELKGIGKKVGDSEADRLDCDPKELNEALTTFLAEKKRILAFIPECTTGSSIADKGVGPMISFARRCLQDSGLPPTELVPHQKTIRDMDEIRDDKAQSFIRTLNAIEDRNSLAGLALVIAITVDSLIFFAGVFAATTMTSPLEKAGLRDLAKQVRQMLPRDVRWALGKMRDHAFARAQCDDPRINTIVTLGLARHIPTEPEHTFLVESQASGDSTLYVLHQIYRDELHEIVRKAERRGELDPEPEQSPGWSGSAGPRNERVVVFAPRPSAGRSA